MTLRVLLINELGGGLWHARQLGRLAEALAAEGAACTVALPEQTLRAAAALGLAEAVGLPPVFKRPAYAGRNSTSYGDLLTTLGFADPVFVAERIDLVERLIERVRPGLVVADFAPSAMLAAAGRLPVVWLGIGYTVPPLRTRPSERFLEVGDRLADETVLVETLAAVQARRGAPPVADLAGAFPHAARFVCAYAELDLYDGRRAEPAVGPLEVAAPLPPPPGGPRLLAYLPAGHRQLPALVDGMVGCGLAVSLYVPEAPADLAGRLAGTAVTLTARPHRLPDDLAGASLVLHSGGSGVAETCLGAGRPQLCAPSHMEQALLARRLQQRGVARFVPPTAAGEAVAQLIRQAADDANLRTWAAVLAGELHRRHPLGSLPLVVAACRRHLAAPGGGTPAGLPPS